MRLLLLICTLYSSFVFAYENKDFHDKRIACMDMTGRINYYLDFHFLANNTFELKFQEDEPLIRGLRGDFKIEGNEIHLRGRPYYESNQLAYKNKVEEMNNKLRNSLYKESFYHIVFYTPAIKSLELDEIDIDKKKPPTSRFCKIKS